MTRESSLFSRFTWGELLAFAGLLVLTALPIVMRSSGVLGIPIYVGVFLFVIVGAVITPAARSHWVNWSSVSFIALACYALASSLLSDTGLGVVDRLMPMASAIMCIVAARMVAMRVDVEGQAEPALLRLAAVLVLVTFPFILKIVLGKSTAGRLETSLGGASVVYMVPMLALGLSLHCWRRGFERRTSAVLGAMALISVIATGSRAATLLTLAYIAVLVVDWRRPRSLAMAMVGMLMMIPFAATYKNGRLLNFTDSSRSTNYGNGLGFWSESPFSMLFGAGVGRVWPWYPLESATQQRTTRIKSVMSQHGDLLSNPHSLPIAVIVEMGIVGVVMLVCTLLPLLWAFRVNWRSHGRVAEALIWCLALTLPGTIVELYLFKNFPISFAWWITFFITLRVAERADAGLVADPDWSSEDIAPDGDGPVPLSVGSMAGAA